MSQGVPWLDAKTYYSRRWGEPVGRIGVDGGFSCPNRGADRRSSGCSFCAEAANRPPYQAGTSDLAEQIAQGRAFQTKRYGVRLFSLYFQSFSSTWAPVEQLRRIYDQGLGCGPFVELTVGTRPDCLPESTVDLLASYRSAHRDVWVEVGLQTSNDTTLAAINRGHGFEEYSTAAERLRGRGLPFTTHVMFGLPGETASDFVTTVKEAVDRGTSGLKLHDLILAPGTELHRRWQAGQIRPVVAQEYLDAVAEALRHVPPDVVVWRVCSDPEDRKTDPPPGEKWPKNRFLNELRTAVQKQQTP